MSTFNTYLTNGVSYGAKYALTAQDVIDTTVTIKFVGCDRFNLSPTIILTSDAGVVVTTAGLELDNSVNGEITISVGTSTVFLEDYVINMVASANREGLDY